MASQAPRQLDLAPWGFAPGFSLFYCSDCQHGEPEAGHKHSTRCATHALEARSREGTELQDPAPLMEDCSCQMKLRLMIFGAVIGAGIIFGSLVIFH